MPLTKRFFLYSHTGLWRVCRYTVIPEPLTDFALPRNFTELSLNDQTDIDRLKAKLARESYVDDFLTEFEEPIDEIITIDEPFKRALFANWLRNSPNFAQLKTRYKGVLESDMLKQQSSLLAERAAAALTAPTLVNTAQTTDAKSVSITSFAGASIDPVVAGASTDPVTAQAANETVGGVVSVVPYNNTFIKILVPEALRQALFAYWEDKAGILSLLWPFAIDMDIPVTMTNANGKKLIIRPPPPPKDGKSHGHFKYTSNGMCFWVCCCFFFFIFTAVTQGVCIAQQPFDAQSFFLWLFWPILSLLLFC